MGKFCTANLILNVKFTLCFQDHQISYFELHGLLLELHFRLSWSNFDSHLVIVLVQGNKISIFGADSLVRDRACILNFHSHFHYQSIIAKAEESDNQIYQSQLPIHHFPFLR
jgi:hypothetical protein